MSVCSYCGNGAPSRVVDSCEHASDRSATRRKCLSVLKSSYLFLVFSSRSHLAQMSHSPYTSLRDRLSDHIVLAHAMHTVRLPVCTTHDEAWWCSHRRRVHASPDLCKSMQDKVYATCQGDTMRHPRGFAGAELRMSHLFHGLAVAWADGRSTAASRWHQVNWRGREYIGPGISYRPPPTYVEVRKASSRCWDYVDEFTYKLSRIHQW